MIHHLTITKNLEKEVQCLCFTVLRFRVGLMLVFMSLPFSFGPPSGMQWTNQMRLSHKLLGKHKLNCNASDCCFYPNYCYYHQNFVKIEAIGSKEGYLSPFTSKVQINHYLSHLCPDLILN